MEDFNGSFGQALGTSPGMESGGEPNIENDREFKAHIYQQLVDLQPYLAPESQIAVLVHNDRDLDSGMLEYGLTLAATLGEYKLETEGHSHDVYEAFAEAKRKMIEQLDDYYNAAIDQTERDAQIQSLLDGSATVH